MAVSANETQTIVFNAEVLKGGFVLQAVEEANGNERLLASTNLLPGGSGDDGASVAQNFTLTITPQTNAVKLRLSSSQNLGNAGVGVSAVATSGGISVSPGQYTLVSHRVTVKVNYLAQEQFTVTLCDSIDEKYRFGFNGQEKVNEIAGIGNHNTAEFWEYDTRLGRRWNVDPVDQVSISNYAAMRNNPIYNIDVNGDVAGDYYSNKGEYLGNDGKLDNLVYVINDNKRARTEDKSINWGGTLSEEHSSELKQNSEVAKMP